MPGSARPGAVEPTRSVGERHRQDRVKDRQRLVKTDGATQRRLQDGNVTDFVFLLVIAAAFTVLVLLTLGLDRLGGDPR